MLYDPNHAGELAGKHMDLGNYVPQMHHSNKIKVVNNLCWEIMEILAHRMSDHQCSNLHGQIVFGAAKSLVQWYACILWMK